MVDAYFSESLTSTDTGFGRCFSTPRQGLKFLVFDCEESSNFLTVGSIIDKKALKNAEEVQRDLILSYGRLFYTVICQVYKMSMD